MKNKGTIFFITLMLIAGTAGALTWLRSNQRLGQPGIIASSIPGEVRMQIGLPAVVDSFSSTNVPESELELNYFPKDTSYVRRCYFSGTNDLPIYATVIMMGADRTSIHKPDYCLPGQGWTIEDKSIVKIPITGENYDMPVAKWVIRNTFSLPDGSRQAVSGIYMFWFVADSEQTPDHYQRLWWLTRDMFTKGVLQRWAYISYFAPCEPGKEDVTAERVKRLIADSTAKFQMRQRSSR